MNPKAEVRLRAAILWHDTILFERTFPRGRTVCAGSDGRCDLVLPESAGLGLRHELLRPEGEAYVLALTPVITGAHWHGEAPADLAARFAAGETEVEVRPGDRGIIRLGGLAIWYDLGEVATRPPVGAWWRRLEAPMLGSLGTAMTLHLAFLILAFLFWDEQPALAALHFEERTVQVALQPPVPPPPEEDASSGQGEPMPEEEGAVGAPEEIRPTKVPRREGPKAKALRRARDSTLLKTMDRMGDVFGNTDDLRASLDVAMDGSGDVAQLGPGNHGLGLRNRGSGGGGDGPGGLLSMGGPGDLGGRGGRGRGGLGDKKKQRAPTVRAPKPGQLAGFCKEADILRVVRTRQQGVSFCYEKALARRPDLSGKLTLRWRIDLDGSLSQVQVAEDSLGDAEVAGCVRRVVERWRFPRPEGGQCVVHFPFVFTAGE